MNCNQNQTELNSKQYRVTYSEAATGGVLKKICKIHRKTLVLETMGQVFSCEFSDFFKNTFSYRTPPGDCFRKYSSVIIYWEIITPTVLIY